MLKDESTQTMSKEEQKNEIKARFDEINKSQQNNGVYSELFNNREFTCAIESYKCALIAEVDSLSKKSNRKPLEAAEALLSIFENNNDQLTHSDKIERFVNKSQIEGFSFLTRHCAADLSGTLAMFAVVLPFAIAFILSFLVVSAVIAPPTLLFSPLLCVEFGPTLLTLILAAVCYWSRDELADRSIKTARSLGSFFKAPPIVRKDLVELSVEPSNDSDMNSHREEEVSTSTVITV